MRLLACALVCCLSAPASAASIALEAVWSIAPAAAAVTAEATPNVAPTKARPVALRSPAKRIAAALAVPRALAKGVCGPNGCPPQAASRQPQAVSQTCGHAGCDCTSCPGAACNCDLEPVAASNCQACRPASNAARATVAAPLRVMKRAAAAWRERRPVARAARAFGRAAVRPLRAIRCRGCR